MSLLPTILFLGTEVLKESKNDAVLSEAGILLLQRAAECRAVRVHEETNNQHAQLLQSTLAKIVDRVKSGLCYYIVVYVSSCTDELEGAADRRCAGWTTFDDTEVGTGLVGH